MQSSPEQAEQALEQLERVVSEDSHDEVEYIYLLCSILNGITDNIMTSSSEDVRLYIN